MSADAFACDGTNPSPVDALTCNVFHEARGLRGPNNEGWTSVMEVVVNRVEDSRFPNTIPEVVYQTTASGCQFSWYCDGKSDKIINVAKYQEIRQVVVSFLRDYDAGKRHHLTKGAHSYHASTVPRNSYFKRLVKTFEVKEEGKVVSHIFYRDPEIREIARN
jgi:spore germination cell wall hydrolase CwlJ-like protein